MAKSILHPELDIDWHKTKQPLRLITGEVIEQSVLLDLSYYSYLQRSIGYLSPWPPSPVKNLTPALKHFHGILDYLIDFYDSETNRIGRMDNPHRISQIPLPLNDPNLPIVPPGTGHHFNSKMHLRPTHSTPDKQNPSKVVSLARSTSVSEREDG